MLLPIELSHPCYHDEGAARVQLELIRWPDGPYCPICGSFDRVKPYGGKAMGPGWYWCTPCRRKFTVRVGSIFGRSHIPIYKWLLGFRLMAGSKKGFSAHQMHRTLKVDYKTAWFMEHRIRECMDESASASQLGGEDKFVEADETYVGGKARNRAYKAPPPKKAVFSLVERDGKARSFHIANVTAETVRPLIVTVTSRKSHFRTDESGIYWKVGEEFKTHRTVNHSAEEYVRGGPHKHSRRHVLYPKAWDLWNIPARERSSSSEILTRIRFSLQQPRRARYR